MARASGLQLAVASIDDFYYPWPERQRRLAGNPFGVSRVPPGSHDLPLVLERLAAWRSGAPLRLTRFDKGLADGEGDRCGDQVVDAEALLIEGWLMGCRCLGEERLAAWRPEHLAGWALTAEEWSWLPRWDRELAAYQQLWAACDGLWVLRPLRWSLPRRWRFQAEARQRRLGLGSLGPAALDRLVRASLHSLPPPLYQDPLLEGWTGVDPDPSTRLSQDAGVEAQQPPGSPFGTGVSAGAEATPRGGTAGSAQTLPLLGVTVLDGRRRAQSEVSQPSLSSASLAIG
jgi:D-glycerate 3-kinase